MEEVPVIIVGAGPTGVVLSLLLAQHEISSVILEKENGIEQDPRAAVISNDAVRIVWDLGLGDHMSSIGSPFKSISWHESKYCNSPVLTVDWSSDTTNQVVPNGIRHVQPLLEQALRAELEKHKHLCELRSGCEVVSREELDDGVVVEYRDTRGQRNRIKGSWLVGADGKTGIVRKHFLERQAGIKQQTGLYDYTGTWVAANLKIKLPASESHPDFPLWSFGLSPEQVYDLFWPDEWHFCKPPGRPTAGGSIGPRNEHWWRHEFKIADEDSAADAEDLLWEHLTPMITRTSDADGREFPGGKPVTFPRDCIDVRRCRPYTFAAKVVNKWFSKRTILVGDAAHIFPPFAGQGMASGIRDAHALAWRLALLTRAPPMSQELTDKFLDQFARERRQAIDDATTMTIANAVLIDDNGGSTVDPSTPPPGDVWWQAKGYKGVDNGFFLSEHGGGGKMAQIYAQSAKRGPSLSDALFRHGSTAMTLLVVGAGSAEEHNRTKELVDAAGLPPAVLSDRSIIHFDPARYQSTDTRKSSDKADGHSTFETFLPCSSGELRSQICPPGYDETAFQRRLGEQATYVLVRSDWIVFSTASDVEELITCLDLLKQMISV